MTSIKEQIYAINYAVRGADLLVHDNTVDTFRQSLNDATQTLVGYEKNEQAAERALKRVKEIERSFKLMINLAEYGAEVAANNSRPEERGGHLDGLLAEIENAKKLLNP